MVAFFISFGVVTVFNRSTSLSTMLAPTWLHFRGPGASWGPIGRFWAALGLLGDLGSVFAASWARLGVLGHLGQGQGIQAI